VVELRKCGVTSRVSLGRGLVIDRLSDEDAELVMNACSARGHYFVPVRQFGQRYSFVREVSLEEWEKSPFAWDTDGVIWDALSLSRLIRDNGYSTQYAARIVDYEDGEQMVVYTLGAESKHIYRLRQNAEWLDVSEGEELRKLLSDYWAIEDDLPRRVSRAMWRTEYSSSLKWADVMLPTLVGGLEALLKIERHNAGKQFATRVPALGRELGNEISSELCDRLYDARSAWVHGARVRLFATGQEAVAEGSPPADQRAGPFGDCSPSGFAQGWGSPLRPRRRLSRHLHGR
jgi:hypothetical protein